MIDSDDDDRLATHIGKMFHLPLGDLEFATHELAHFAMLFGRRVVRRRDIADMQRTLDRMPVGVAQLHELRVVALQRAVQPALGIRFPIRHAVASTWLTLHVDGRDSDRLLNGGRPVVHSQAAIRRAIATIRPGVRTCRALRSMLIAAIKDCGRQLPDRYPSHTRQNTASGRILAQ